MLLKKLIKNLSPEQNKIKIRGLSIDSKKIHKGFIFFAIKGHRLNGEKFIHEAVKKGASVIICSNKCRYVSKKILVIKTSNIRNLLGEICSKFFKLKPKNILAVTGTNGKTSVADLFYQILQINQVPVASIGTLGIKYKNQIFKLNLTTPDTIFLHKSLENIKKNKIDNVIVEASSHGLDQKRVNHLNLKAGIFTNLSQDHLDYHKSMRSYFNSKLVLFKNIIPEKKTIIADSSIKQFKTLKKISKKRNLNLIDANIIEKKLYNFLDNKYNEFQLKNLSMAISAAKLCNLSEKKIFNSLNQIKDVNGRLELVKTFSNKVNVYVDFAHTPDALEKSLKSLTNSHGKNISVVFGCGGDRDYKKRPLMGKIAAKFCKKIYVTDDNPRNEKPEKIRRQIIKRIKHKRLFNIGKRDQAIKYAILGADPHETILVAGKGHETQQIFRNKVVSFSDKEIIKNIKINRSKIKKDNLNFIQNKNIIKSLKKNKKINNFHGLAIDSRIVKKNNLFLTIKGKNNDGIKFIPNAIKKGASYIVSSKNIKKNSKKIIKVKSEQDFLNYFASKKREGSNAKIIAVTGSAGKTSLKDLINTLLQNFGETFSSPKSYNNHYGVPLSLSQLSLRHEYGVFEVGMSKSGEIDKLTKLIRPHVGIITNIGEAHIENFKNLKGIARAKGELIDNIEENGSIILNRDDKFFNFFKNKAKSKKLKIYSFGMSKKSDVYPISIKENKQTKVTKVKFFNKILNFDTLNINIYNVLSALILLRLFNLDFTQIYKCFKKIEPTSGRGKIHSVMRYNKKFKLIDESYNANPLSVKNAIGYFKSIKKQNFKKYLLLGDMLELGKKSEKLHKDLSKVINSSDIDKVFIKGDKTLTTYKNINKSKRGNILQQYEDVDFTLNNIIANNDYLMIKGSNATGLNYISKKFIKGY